MIEGLRKTPIILPNAELKIAAASSPPDAFVRTVTEFVVDGNAAQITMPFAMLSEITPSDVNMLVNPYMTVDTTMKQ